MDTLPIDQEIAVLEEELARRRADLYSAERAPSEGRTVDPEMHRHSVQAKRWALMECERALRRLREILEDDAA